MESPTWPRSPFDSLTRRQLLVGAAATAVLAACGSSEGDSSSGSADTGGAGSAPGAVDADGTYVIVQRFRQDVQEPGDVRLAISLADESGALISSGPDTLAAQVTDIDGNPVGEAIAAAKRPIDPAAYYAFRTTIDTPGVYYLVVDGGPAEGAAFQVMEAGSVAVAGPGDPLPPFDTPTTADARGVDPICTRQPEPCPFHETTLTEALASGRPVVYLIGTPAFCQTGTCAPALESIIGLQDRYGDTFAFVHAEVYTDNTATTTAPAVEAAALGFEPVLFVTDATGTVVDRLDAVWDETELAEVLDSIAS